MALAAAGSPKAETLYPIVKGTGVAAAIAAVVALFIPYPMIADIALLVLVAAGAAFVFHGSTLAALKLRSRRRVLFQILVVLAVPSVLTAYFVSSADAVPVETIKGWLGYWSLLPLGILGLIGYALRGAIDREVPARIFLAYAGVLFAICFIGAAGYHYESDDDEHGSWYHDERQAIKARKTGQYAVQFPIYVAAAYGGLVMGLAKRAECCGGTKPFSEAISTASVSRQPFSVTRP